jgi:tetratricopeptide (TPR) repeat protein
MRTGLLRIVGEISNNKTWYNRLRFYLASLLFIVVVVVAWPPFIIASYARFYNKKYVIDDYLSISAETSLETIWPKVSIAMFAIAFIVFTANYFIENGNNYFIIFLIMILIQTNSRQLFYIIRDKSLPSELRVGSANPYISFILILVMDLLAIITAFYPNIYSEQVKFIDASLLAAITIDILTLKKVKIIFTQEYFTIFDYAIGISSLIYYITLFRTMLKYKEFRKTGEDYQKIAYFKLNIGKYNDALNLLEKAKPINPSIIFLKAGAYIGVQQFDEALKCANKHLELEDKVVDDVNAYGVLRALFLFVKYDVTITKAFLRYMINKNASDINVLTLLNFTMQIGVINPTHVTELLTDKKISNRYPLTYNLILFLKEEFEEIKQNLENYTPSNVIEKILWLQLGLLVDLVYEAENDGDKKEYYKSWTDKNYNELCNLADNISNDYDKLIACSAISEICILSQMLAPERSEQYIFLNNKLMNGMTDDNMSKLAQKIGEKMKRVMM